ncbi:HAMP domain-containing sensor histidine kinase [uncultured Paenibacillus sp.]|uniref:sensor histidine kinase n=1 Tax=uncultured Paenibacillus sp. TaxID=227322 RepID=UPI0015B17968|nr:ATP-binding protein [uncultured Paenibacillus sp.]
MPGLDLTQMKDTGNKERREGEREPIVNRLEQAVYALRRAELELEQKKRELERLNRELAKAQASADASKQAKRDFLAMVGHEIRSPLNGVFAMSELLLETELTEEQKKYAGMIFANANALLSMFDDILDFTRLSQDRLEGEETPFALREGIRDIFTLFRQETLSKGVDLYFVIDERIPDLLYGDIRRLSKVLIHLLANAVKFTDKGKVYMIVASEKPAKSGNIGLSFTIGDTGIGIPADRMLQLFEPFAQFDSSMTRRYGGLGLGLAICRKLVNLLGGELQAKPLEENGTAFTFALTFRSMAPGEAETR